MASFCYDEQWRAPRALNIEQLNYGVTHSIILMAVSMYLLVILSNFIYKFTDGEIYAL